jgi:hypothetical protein
MTNPHFPRFVSDLEPASPPVYRYISLGVPATHSTLHAAATILIFAASIFLIMHCGRLLRKFEPMSTGKARPSARQIE